MGARGPKPLPGNVHLLRGNASKKPLHELTGVVSPDVDIPGCPRHLLPEARKEWRRIAPELQALGLISRLDRAALALYCQEWAWLVWHESRLQDDIARVAKEREAWEADPANAGQAWTKGDGYMLPTPNGAWTYNPHWTGRNKAAERVDKFLASFGLSPSARGRVTPSANQMPLPGMDAPQGGFEAL